MKKRKILAAAMATMLCSLLPMQVSAAATYGEDHTDFEISHSYFMSLNNMIYGAYSVTVTYGDLNQYSDVIGVVVYDE